MLRPGLFASLRFQTAAAFMFLVLLFAAAGAYSIAAFSRQIAYDALVEIAARLELTAQQIHAQAMNYKQNAPRDYPTYYRDVRLYYQDLIGHMKTFDRIIDRFMKWDFGDEMGRAPSSDSAVMEATRALRSTWLDYRRGLVEALGPDPGKPRLEWAAEHNISHHRTLAAATAGLTERLRSWTEAEHDAVRRVAAAVVALAVAFSVLVLVLLYRTAVIPLRRALVGFARVTDGDFGYRLAESGNTEIRSIVRGFNRLSERLYLLFRLLERLQEGNNLDDVIGFLSREFADLLGIDWVGVLFVVGDGAMARLEVSYLDGRSERVDDRAFMLAGTVLDKALELGRPLHLSPLEALPEANSQPFVRSLVARSLREAVLLPLHPGTQTPIPAVVVFATRETGRYDDAYMAFMGNIAHLVTHSFGKTVRLAEHARLAAIGEFASSIAHELRTPLATVGLALDYYNRLELPEAALKRNALARSEIGRMQRLLDDILLYAKPLTLHLRTVDAVATLRSFIETHAHIAQPQAQCIRLQSSYEQALVSADPDRLQQMILNLTKNACEAAPQGSDVVWSVHDRPGSAQIALTIVNGGKAIPADLLPRVTEPFFSTKAGGTGLGLAIVQRLAMLHGADLVISSSSEEGTRVTLHLTRVRAATCDT